MINFNIIIFCSIELNVGKQNSSSSDYWKGKFHQS